jgi:peptidase A4-like protein
VFSDDCARRSGARAQACRLLGEGSTTNWSPHVMRSLLRRSFLGLVFLAACAQGEADPASQTTDASARAAKRGHIVHRMPRGSTSTVSVHTLPSATCRLRPDDPAADPARTLRVFSDDDGIARVHLDHLDPKVDGGSLLLDCTDDAGARASHSIDVVIDDQAQPQAPERYHREGKPTLDVVPGDPRGLSDQDIQARHYPPRPDAQANPDQYAAWQQLVTSGPTLIAPHGVVDHERVHSLSRTSDNWSGYVITSPTSQPIYSWVYGNWAVPRAYAESGFSSWDHSSFWVGIDGYGSNDVVQDGTDQNTLTFFWVQSSSYDGWVEWYPQSSISISNFPVNPGDRVHFWTLAKDAAGNYTSTPNTGWFYMWNQTQNVYLYYTIGIPSGAVFSGHQAEWIMERPTVLGSTSSLADYNFAQMNGALAYDLWGGRHLYGGDATSTSLNVTMINSSNGNKVLSQVYPTSDTGTMSFYFRAHQ